MLVAGGPEAALLAAAATDLPNWLGRTACTARRVGSVCTGAFLLGWAGLLDGRRATTHWRGCERLQALFPAARVDADAIHAFDGVYTSAGVTAGIDLALALVAEDLDDTVAAEIARDLVVYLRRSGGQSQYSRMLPGQFRTRVRVEHARDLLERSDWALDRIAERSGFGSIDAFQRAFKAMPGTAPSVYRARFTAASG